MTILLIYFHIFAVDFGFILFMNLQYLFSTKLIDADMFV